MCVCLFFYLSVFIIIYHYLSLFIIIYHYLSLFIIIYHYFIYHYLSLFIINHYLSLFIIIYHYLSLFIIICHYLSFIIIYHYFFYHYLSIFWFIYISCISNLMNEGRNLSQNPKKLYHKRLLTRRSDPSHQWLLHSLPWNQAKTQHPLITYSTDGRCHPLAGVGVANGVPTDHFLPKLRQTAYVALGFSTGIWKPQGFPSQLVPEDFGMDFTAASPRQGTWHHPSPPDEAVFKLDLNQWIGLRENLQESPIFNGKIYGFL